MRVKHVVTSLTAHVDKLINQIENHEAIAQASIDEARQLTAKIHCQLKHAQAEKQRLHTQQCELEQQCNDWQRRAKALGHTDRDKALRCLQAYKQADAKRQHTAQQIAENQQLCHEMQQHLHEAEQHLTALQHRKQQLSAREAKNSVIKTREQLHHTPTDTVFDRWEQQVMADEYRPNSFQHCTDDFEQHFAQEEQQHALEAELDDLLTQDKTPHKDDA